MDELYAKEVEEILNLGSIGIVKRRLDKLIESSNHDHYVIATAIEYKLKHGLGYCAELINEIIDDEKYRVFATYYKGYLYNKKGNREKALETLENILHEDGEYAEKARRLFPEILYNNEEYDNVLLYFDYLKENNDMNDVALFYASKIYYFKHDIETTLHLAEEAIKLNPDEIKYHTFLRAVYQDSKDYKNALKEIRILKSMNISSSLRNKLDILLPTIYEELNYGGKAFSAIKENVQKGITNTNQEKIYFKLASLYGDFKTVDELSDKMKGLNSFCSQHLRPLVTAYQNENLCDKAIGVIDSDYVDKTAFEVQLYKANILIQMKKYKEAKIILEILMNKSNNPVYRLSYALCLFNEGKFDEARNLMQSIPTVDNRLCLYLKYELGILDLSIFRNIPSYAKLLNDYDFETVYRDTRNRLNRDDKPYRVYEEINIKKFIYEMKSIIESLEPSYTFDKDSYLIDYGTNIAHLNGTPTSYFLVDAIPGGNIITMKPVIPSKDGVKNYQRVR